MKYTKKSEIIEAFKFTGGIEQVEDPTWIIDMLRNGDAEFKNEGTKEVSIIIKTVEGNMNANVGDYIMLRFDGRAYPCGQDIFESTYKLI